MRTQKESFFAVSDIHGMYGMFKDLLNYWNKDEEQLVVCGDYIDKGTQSLEVIRLLMDLKASHDAVILMGNHEEMFLSWLDDPSSHYFNHLATIKSFLSYVPIDVDPHYLADRIKSEFKEEIDFMRDSINYLESDHYVFVHAGVDPDLEDWRQSKDIDFRWVRELFIYTPNTTGKTVVFGHTPTYILNEDGSFRVWQSSDNKIGIDGGASMGGQLHGVKLGNGKVKGWTIGRTK